LNGLPEGVFEFSEKVACLISDITLFPILEERFKLKQVLFEGL
jgi:hypothetical protein